MPSELTWLPAWRIRDLIAKGEVSAINVTEHFLGRIEALEPTLHLFADLDAAGAREQARRADSAVRRGDELGPLHGIPVSVKEIVAVEDMHKRGGRGAPSTLSRFDDIGVARLRAAGAVIFGLNTMMGTGGGGQMAGSPKTYTYFNWDAEARNPWDPNKVPGWSSSGSAAAVAAGVVPVAIGSDGGGSARLPAAYCGLVGVHPTRGLVPSIDYDKPTLRLTQTIGPLVRNVRDAAIVMQAMAGPDGRDYICLQENPPDYLTTLERGVEGLRLAWTNDLGFASLYAAEDSERVITHIRNAAMGFRTLGASLEVTTEVWEDPKRLSGPAPGEPDVYEVASGRNTDPLPAYSPESYQTAAESRARNWDRFSRLFREFDLLLSPTSQRLARSVEEWDAAWTTDGSRYPGGLLAPTYVCYTALFNILGFPAVNVPCGFVDGLPVGLQIVGAPGREDRIFQAAAAFENAFGPTERPDIANF